ncbi:MAG: hypothetical protein JSV88_11960 [Candidatus Aminicenantes bacterium]|nr:MAG: hypothetical protein JSV88_11960 [Candidatus Aminicenantes bacterium]
MKLREWQRYCWEFYPGPPGIYPPLGVNDFIPGVNDFLPVVSGFNLDVNQFMVFMPIPSLTRSSFLAGTITQ